MFGFGFGHGWFRRFLGFSVSHVVGLGGVGWCQDTKIDKHRNTCSIGLGGNVSAEMFPC